MYARATALALTLFTAPTFAVHAQEGTPPTPAPSGIVQMIPPNLCIEPGHPSYGQVQPMATYPSMRVCIINGGSNPSAGATPTPAPTNGTATVEGTPATAQTAPQPVRQTAEGLCLEPNHPAYNTATIRGTYPDMRTCFVEGGRRDTPIAVPTPAPDGSVASAPNTTVPNAEQMPTGITPLVQTPTPFGDSVASAQPRRNQPGSLKGITLPPQPSYSEAPGLFRPPADYFGRGPEDFWP